MDPQQLARIVSCEGITFLAMDRPSRTLQVLKSRHIVQEECRFDDFSKVARTVHDLMYLKDRHWPGPYTGAVKYRTAIIEVVTERWKRIVNDDLDVHRFGCENPYLFDDEWIPPVGETLRRALNRQQS